MEWLQAFMIAGSTVGACWWMHKETKEIAKENKDLAREIAKESKDFHGRMCTLEQKYIEMMQRFMEKK